jgi:hypothetical protein
VRHDRGRRPGSGSIERPDRHGAASSAQERGRGLVRPRTLAVLTVIVENILLPPLPLITDLVAPAVGAAPR